MDYRTERDALRGRVDNLEQNLTDAKQALAAQQSGDEAEQVARLEKQLAEAQVTLQELSRSLAALKGTPASPRPRRIAAMLVAFGCAMVGGLLFVSRRVSAPSPPPVSTILPAPVLVDPPPIATPPPPPSPAAEPLTLEVKIGGKGDGPGLFDDPREVAPLLDGGFFVADYATGRVQRFDAAGKYLAVITVAPGTNGPYILDIAASGDGKLYVVRAGELLRFSVADGKKLNPLPPPMPGATYRHVFVDAANDVYALSVEKDETRGALSKFRNDGKLLERWPRQAAAKEVYLNHDRVAANAAGTMFVTHDLGAFVEVLDPKGAVQNRIGQEGKGPGELQRMRMGSIDVDGHGHVLVANGEYISVFDAGGRFRGDLHFKEGPDSAGYVRAFRVGADGRVYAATNQNKAIVYRLDPFAVEALGR